MFWLVVGYLFLFIFRPYEFWPILGYLRIERIYMIFLLIALFLWPQKRYIHHPINKTLILFFFIMIISSVLALNRGDAFVSTYNYFKLVVFYFVILFTIQDEEQLKNFLIAYIIIMLLYVGKSSWEFFLHDRFMYRMGTKRMMGIDLTYGDPNSFAASIIYSLPFLWGMIKFKLEKPWIKKILYAYGILSLVAIICSGSRAGMVSGLLFFFLVWLKTSQKMIGIILICILLFLTWYMMPERYRLRFMTIYTSGISKSADVSAQGRIYTLKRGFDMFKKKPVFGVGPGNFKRGLALFGDYSGTSSHNLYGSMFGELGLLGTLAFILLIYKIIETHWLIIAEAGFLKMEENNFFSLFSVASIQGIILLLFNGNFGGNLYRYNWLWIGAIGVLLWHFINEFKTNGNEYEGIV
ncbi:MAG: O-antigen ligase family protein [bacterium]